MLLKKLLANVNENYADIDIKGVTCDSRRVEKGFAFVCISGSSQDGHDYAEKAEQSGAAVIISQRKIGVSNEITVPDTHEAYSDICAAWFGHPAKALKLIGVTGTNGKTSVTYMLKSILENAGHKVGLIGTIQNMIGDTVIETKNTTPDAYELNRLFSLMKQQGCDYVVMEVSSHALDQKRVCNLNFEAAVFTNLTQDHLDYHITMENYLAAKKKLFKMCKTAIINADDRYFEQLVEGLNCRVVTYSMGDSATYSAKAVNYYPTSVEYELVSDTILNHIRFNTGGKFSVYNSMCAAITAIELGIPVAEIAETLANMSGIKGRAESVPTGRDFSIIIDYAHTPDGLKNILSTFRDCKKNRVIALFGCGGDRDKTKRAVMGNIAVRYADYVIVTSDNPRSEDPMSIINDILVGTEGINTPLKVIENRIEAIKYAVSIAKTDDIIVLAGKGHETYQILKDATIHLDEREVVAQALSEL